MPTDITHRIILDSFDLAAVLPPSTLTTTDTK